MGIITSSLRLMRETYLSLQALASEISTTNSDFNALLSRISVPPGIPVPSPTAPFWLEDPPFPELCDIGSAAAPGATLPQRRAHVVVIGSGMTGAAACRTVLREGERLGLWKGGMVEEDRGRGEKKVVMVEARAVCSGATGRNGGHVKVSPLEEVRALRRKGIVGEKAGKIVGFQGRHLGLLAGLCKAEGIEVAELREVKTVDLFVDREAWEEAKECAEELGEEQWMDEMDWGLRIWEGEEMREKFHTSSHVVGAISYRAGAMWPYRLVTCILSSLLRDYSASFSIETHTAVQSISEIADPDAPFCLHTSRGDIIATHVIHATNGHSANLIPGLLGKLFPVRGQMTAQRPGKLFPHLGGTRSWSIIHNKSGLEYITQRPGVPNSVGGNGGELMLGGALWQSGNRGLDEIGMSNDAEVNFNVGTYLGGILPMLFGTKYWGPDAETGRVKSMWTGIMGFTVDMMPFIGRLESSITRRKVPKRTRSDSKGKERMAEPGEWIAAGYNGEGMVNAWLCGVAVGLMVLGKEGTDLEAEPGMPGGRMTEWLPTEYLISKERLAKSSIYDLASLV